MSILALAATASLASCKAKEKAPPGADAPPVATGPKLGLVVEAPGNNPKAMSHATAPAEPFQLRFDTETKTKRGNLVSSTITVTGNMTPTLEGDAGTLAVAVGAIVATDRDRQLIAAAGVNHYLKAWQPLTLSFGLTRAGELASDGSDWQFPDILFNQAQALHDTVGKWLPVYPPTPIGDGAVWNQTKEDVVNGIKLTRATKYTLTWPDAPATEPRALTATFSEQAGPQQAIVDGAPLQVARYAAEGATTYTFHQASAVAGWPQLSQAQGTITVTLTFDNQGTEESIVRTTAWTMTWLGAAKPMRDGAAPAQP